MRLGSKHFGFVWLLMIILLAISYGGFAIAHEIEAKTMMFLLPQPIRRGELYIARLAAGATGLALICANDGMYYLAASIFIWLRGECSTVIVGWHRRLFVWTKRAVPFDDVLGIF